MNRIDFQRALNAERQHYQDKIQEQSRSHDREVDQIEKTYNYRDVKKDRVHAEKIKELEDTYSRNREDMSDYVSQELDLKRRELRNRLEDVRRDYEDRSHDQRNQYSKQLANLSNEYNNKFNVQDTMNNADRVQRERWHQDQVKHLQEAHIGETEKRKDMYDARVERMRQDNVDLQDMQREKLRDQNRIHSDEVRRIHQKYTVDTGDKLKELNDVYDRKLENKERYFENTKDNLKRSFDRTVENYEDKNRELKDFYSYWSGAEKEDLVRDRDKLKEDLSLNYRKSLAKKNIQLEDRREQYEELSRTLKNNTDAHMKRQDYIHKIEQENAKKQFAASLEAQHTSHKETVDNMREDDISDRRIFEKNLQRDEAERNREFLGETRRKVGHERLAFNQNLNEAKRKNMEIRERYDQQADKLMHDKIETTNQQQEYYTDLLENTREAGKDKLLDKEYELKDDFDIERTNLRTTLSDNSLKAEREKTELKNHYEERLRKDTNELKKKISFIEKKNEKEMKNAERSNEIEKRNLTSFYEKKINDLKKQHNKEIENLKRFIREEKTIG